jgi:hypothetical protein
VEVAVSHHSRNDAVFVSIVVGLAVTFAVWLYFILSTFTTLHQSWSQTQFAVIFCAGPPAMGLVAGWITLYIANRRTRRSVRKIQHWQP